MTDKSRYMHLLILLLVDLYTNLDYYYKRCREVFN